MNKQIQMISVSHWERYTSTITMRILSELKHFHHFARWPDVQANYLDNLTIFLP